MEIEPSDGRGSDNVGELATHTSQRNSVYGIILIDEPTDF